MLNTKIERLRGPSVRLHLSADDWRLYNAETLEQDQERDYAAEDLNRATENAVANAPYASKVIMPREFAVLSKWGATDTPARNVFNNIVEEIYHGKQKYHLA